MNVDFKEFLWSLFEELVNARREREQFKEWWIQERDAHAATQKALEELKAETPCSDN